MEAINFYDDFIRGETDGEAEKTIESIIMPVDACMHDLTEATDKRLLEKWKQHLETHIKRIEENLK